MNDYTAFFNPELESILQEIARNPKAKLLKVPSSGQLICATHDSRASIAAPGLTTAEVELLEVHREELGELIKQRCLFEFFADPEASARLHRSVDANHTLKIQDEATWRTNTVKALELPVNDEGCQIGVDVLSRCIAEGDRPVSIAQLATTLSRVTTMDQAPVYMAIDLLGRDQYASAVKTYEQVLRGGASPLILSYCWEGLSVAHWMRRDPATALEASHQAAAVCVNRPTPLINGIDIAARIGSFREARIACHALDDLGDMDESILSWHSECERTRDLQKTVLPLSKETETWVMDQIDSVGLHSREVLRAVLL